MSKPEPLGRMPVIILLVLVHVTLGAYIPVWFIRARFILARLNTSTEVPPYLPYVLLLFYVLIVCIGIGAATSDLEPGWANSAFIVIAILFAVTQLYLSLQVMKVLHEYSHAKLSSDLTTAMLRATVLSLIGLQYEMNRLPTPVNGMYPCDNRESVVPSGPPLPEK